MVSSQINVSHNSITRKTKFFQFEKEKNVSIFVLSQEFRFLRETPSIASELTTSTSFNQKSDFDLFDRYLYTEREHPFDLDQTQTSVSSSTSNNSWIDGEEEKRVRTRSNLSEESEDESSLGRQRSRSDDDKTGSTIVTNTTLNVTRLFGKTTFDLFS